MKVLIIDNYDSFTYNLYQLVGEVLTSLGSPFILDVVRNDKITVKEIKKKGYDRVIISPGPGSPDDKKYFGVCSEVLLSLGKTLPVLGVCLGMQGLGHYHGATVSRAKLPMHGKSSKIKHSGKHLFKGVPQNVEVMRYHSLVVQMKDLPSCLEVTAKTLDKEPEIMGLRHKEFPICGIQFHPESYATEYGFAIIKNFLLQKHA